MKEYHIFTAAYQFLTAVICLFALSGIGPPETIVIYSLVFGCLTGVRLLFELSGRFLWVPMLLSAAAFATAAILGAYMFPFMGLLAVNVMDRPARARYSVLPSAAAFALLGVIAWPPQNAVLIAVLCVVPQLFLKTVFSRLELAHEQTAARGDENEALRAQLEGQRKMLHTTEHAARLNERNRMASRIHDKLGHGVSGSILLLEGAMLSLDKSPEKAKAAMETAAENLRAAVDDIRTALREERANRGETGLSELAAALSGFEAKYGFVKTGLITEGDLSEISPIVWVCINENLSEALTNLLKHSSADAFNVFISAQKGLVRVQFRDNGNAPGSFSQGMGLGAMEERCALCHGRCFFSATPRGFIITMTFTRQNERQEAQTI